MTHPAKQTNQSAVLLTMMSVFLILFGIISGLTITSNPQSETLQSQASSKSNKISTQAISASKLGVFILSSYSAGAKQIVTAGPNVIKVMDPHLIPSVLQAARDYKSQYPQGIVVLRIYTPGKKYIVTDDPIGSAEEYFRQNIEQPLNTLGSNLSLFDYIESPNEADNTPIWSTIEEMTWLAKFWKRLAELNYQKGIKTCAASIAVGNVGGSNDEEIGQHIAPFVDTLRYLKSIGGAWCYHAYTLQISQDPEIEQWYSLRYRKFYKYLQSNAPDVATIPIILSEGGIDQTGDPKTSGWKGRVSIDQYVAWLKWFDSEIKKDQFVLGTTLFQIGDSTWSSFNLEPLVSPLVAILGATPEPTSCLKSEGQNRISVKTAGTYTLCANQNYSAGIDIQGSNITLDCQNNILDGNINTQQNGININSSQNITVKNCTIKGFKYGLEAQSSNNIHIENSDFSDNSKGGQNQDWLATLMDKTETGGGILLQSVTDSQILNSKASNNIAGVSLFQSSKVEVNGGDYSNNSGWGVRLITTTDSKIMNLKADNNNRINNQCPQGGCESAGILLMQHSDRNRIENNSLNNSGDGFYINGNTGTPSNNNTIIGNTSHSESRFVSGNGFEATFSDGNIFQGNTSTGQNYGFWLGYSEKSVLNGNHIQAALGGISIPASKCNAIIGNQTENGDPSKNHIFPEQQDMAGRTKECRDNYVNPNNSPQINIDAGCTNTSTTSVTSCNLQLTPIPTNTQPTNGPNPTATPATQNPSPTSANQGGAKSLTVNVRNVSSGTLYSGTTACNNDYANKENLYVYITGPDQAPQGFGELLIVPAVSGCTCKSKTPFPYGCSAGSVVWKGADGTSGTSAGDYTATILTTPPGWQVVNKTIQGTLQAAENNLILEVSVKKSEGTIPTVTTSANSSNLTFGYTNRDFEIIMSKYSNEEISPLAVSKWINVATRVPGLQFSTCYPPQCIFTE